MSPPLRSRSVVPFRRNPDWLSVLADENEIMHKSAVATRNPVNRSARYFKTLAVLSLFVLHQEITMANTKTTGSKAATGAASKTAGGSALSQTGAPKKQTSSAAASAASKVLLDGRSSAQSKSAAGSALAQAKGKK